MTGLTLSVPINQGECKNYCVVDENKSHCDDSGDPLSNTFNQRREKENLPKIPIEGKHEA